MIATHPATQRDRQQVLKAGQDELQAEEAKLMKDIDNNASKVAGGWTPTPAHLKECNYLRRQCPKCKIASK